VHLAADEFRARFYPTFRFPDFVAVADLNGDCRLDVAVTYSTGYEASRAFTVLRGVGDGTLLAAEHLDGGNQSSFAVGDLDGDHRNDIVIRSDLNAIPHVSGTGGVTVLRDVTP